MKKSKTRIFVKKTISSNLLIYIKDKQYHFLKNVIRVKINDQIILFDGISGEWKSSVLTVNKDNIVLRVSENIIKDMGCEFKPLETILMRKFKFYKSIDGPRASMEWRTIFMKIRT